MANSKWIAALSLGLVAAGAHFLYVSRLEESVGGGAAVAVLSVTRAVRAGEALAEEDLATRSVPVSYVDDRSVRANRVSELVDMIVNVDLEEGAVIQWTDFAPRVTGARDLAELLEPGKRAVTIPVDRTLSMGGMLRPGHRVDILGTFHQGENRFARVTVTVLQNIRVLATGNRIQSVMTVDREGEEKKPASSSNRRPEFSTVTLSVGLEEAALLALSSKQGPLSLALRGHQDLEVLNGVPEVTMKDIWERDRLPPSTDPATPVRAAHTPIERIRAR